MSGAIPAASSVMFQSSYCCGACWISTRCLVLLSHPPCCRCRLLWPRTHSSALLCALIISSDATAKSLPPPTPSRSSRVWKPLFKLFAVLWVSNYSDCSVYPCLQPVTVPGAWGGGAQLGGFVQLSCVCFCFQHKGSGCWLNTLWICFIRRRRSKQGLGHWPFIRHFVIYMQDSIT